jgi:hypothetical protein
MSKRTPTTEFANLALDELFQLTFVGSQLANDIRCDEEVLRKRNVKMPDVPAITNRPFNDATFHFLGVLMLCRSVDIYNWYCRESLRLAFLSNPKLVTDALRNKTGEMAKTVERAEKKGADAATEVIREFLSDKYRGDRIIRETVHRNLGVMQNPEIELLCTCRNVLVHKRGYDDVGEIAEELKELGGKRAFIGASLFPRGHMPITLDKNNRLIIDDKIGGWAAELLVQQIFMMDQNFSHVYKLPRKIYERVTIGRKWLGTS